MSPGRGIEQPPEACRHCRRSRRGVRHLPALHDSSGGDAGRDLGALLKHGACCDHGDGDDGLLTGESEHLAGHAVEDDVRVTLSELAGHVVAPTPDGAVCEQRARVVVADGDSSRGRGQSLGSPGWRHLKARSAGSRVLLSRTRPARSIPRCESSPSWHSPPAPDERETGARRALRSVHQAQLAVGFNRRRLSGGSPPPGRALRGHYAPTIHAIARTTKTSTIHGQIQRTASVKPACAVTTNHAKRLPA